MRGGHDPRSSLLFLPRVRIREVGMLNGTTGRDGNCSFGSLYRRAGGRLPRGEMTMTTMMTYNGD